ncbi:MAG: molybdate ABC transporter permease subunit [Candidatus Eremiobacteraeota bacterium]|nr:molybdate ABC transporter permease subunit [Candidatus Eremiobacteraeota bacterium]MBC5827054.1 molybdate ABC transporter permease subunit [Candidatus Eremiobacteraeota bacterium]
MTAFIALTLFALLVHSPVVKIVSALHREVVLQALVLSLRTTLVCAVVIVIVGTPLAALLARPFAGRAAVETLITLPIVLPPVVAGLALLLAFGRAGLLGKALAVFGLELPFTTAAVVLAQIFVAAPLYIIAAKDAFARADPDWTDAAATLGASPAYVFMRIIMPPAFPALLSGLALASARALGEFGATITFAGNLPGVTQTMPVAVYMAAQGDMDSSIAIAVVMLAISYGALLGVRLLGSGWGRR